MGKVSATSCSSWPTSCGWDYLSCYGPPPSGDAEPRPSRRPGRPLPTVPMCRRRSAGPLAHVLLYRPPPRSATARPGTRRAAPGRRAHARRLSSPARDAHRAGRQSPHMMPDLAGMGTGRALARRRTGAHHLGMRLRALRAGRRRAPAPQGRPRSPLQTAISARRGYEGPKPVERLRQFGRGSGREAARGLVHAERAARRPGGRGAFRDRLHEPIARSSSSRSRGDAPWCLHLSYIKPHWPYIAPAPYHAMYGHNQILAATRETRERERPAPGLWRDHEPQNASREFSREEVRAGRDPGLYGGSSGRSTTISGGSSATSKRPAGWTTR